MRRLGKVSDDERSLLRVEWRAAVTGTDEARAVQEMLDSLRRMQATTAEIGRLLRSMPAQQPVAEALAADPTESHFDDKTLALAASAAIGLLAIWWSRRREANADTRAATLSAASPQTEPPLAEENEAAPTPGASAASDMTSTAIPVPEQTATPLPEQTATPVPEQSATPVAAQTVASVPLQQAEAPPIEFTLEEADPDAIARANARLQKLQAKRSVRPPTKQAGAHLEPTLELAEIMMSLGLDQGAAETLVEYTEANPRQALHHWLKLLDIYRKSGHMEDFKETAEKLRHNFNIQAEDWARGNEAETPTLESFARLSEHIQNAWTRPQECISYLRNLLEDNRDGERAGFPRPVAEEILLLIEILQETSGAGQAAGV